MSLAICAYIGAVNHELTLQEAPAAIQKRRQRANRPSPPPYYTVTIRPQYRRAGEHADGSTGSKHGYMYDVRGHFRRLPDGRLIWIRPTCADWPTSYTYPPRVRLIDFVGRTCILWRFRLRNNRRRRANAGAGLANQRNGGADGICAVYRREPKNRIA